MPELFQTQSRFIGNLGGRPNSDGCNARLAVHPEGMSDSSRGSQRSGDPRKVWNDAVHPGGMPEICDDLRNTFHWFWHPSGMRYSLSSIPVVSAMLRPPATVCHPCGMNRNDSKTPGDSFPSKRSPDPKFLTVAMRCGIVTMLAALPHRNSHV